MRMNRTTLRLLIAALALLLAVSAGIYCFQDEMRSLLALMQSDRIHPLLVILAFLFLPLVFFPLSALLVLVGIRFNVWGGIAVMLLAMPLHLLFSYWVSHSLVRSRLERFARRNNEVILNVPEDHCTEFAFLFMAVPGLSYSLKNYLLPLSGIRLSRYLAVGWPVQGALGIPFVILGNAAARYSTHLVIVFIILFAVSAVIARVVKRRYRGRFGRNSR